ncbi:hypothetical protein RF11_03398 [Thelohanellus kitauei]|uniref:Uncharacterized protein n=1 Tax=Thelohanellus kitauei TaxID=669202 RepID=A0A0C2J6K8_THEKT|nr:hypothetical protein RF11_03398 [Thelohanellus kitauei]
MFYYKFDNSGSRSEHANLDVTVYNLNINFQNSRKSCEISALEVDKITRTFILTNSRDKIDPAKKNDIISTTESFTSAFTSPATKIDSTTSSTEIYSTIPSTEIASTTISAEIDSTMSSTEIASARFSAEIDSTTPSTEIASTLPSAEITNTTPSTELYSTMPSTEIASKKFTSQTSMEEKTTIISLTLSYRHADVSALENYNILKHLHGWLSPRLNLILFILSSMTLVAGIIYFRKMSIYR